MDVKRSVHQTPESSQAALKGLAAGAAALAGAAAGAAAVGAAAAGVSEEVDVEQEDAIAQKLQNFKDKLDCPHPAGKEKPTIVDLFPDLDDGMHAQTLAYPENGEPLPKDPIGAQTLRYPENGEPLPKNPIGAQTLAYPEGGEPLPKKGGGIPKQTLAFPEGGEPLPKGGIPKQTLAYPEGGEPWPKQKLPFPGQTLRHPEGGDDLGKPFKPGKPSFGPPLQRTLAMHEAGDALPHFKPNPPLQRTLAMHEAGDAHPIKPLKPIISPPCKCVPDIDDVLPGKNPLEFV